MSTKHRARTCQVKKCDVKCYTKANMVILRPQIYFELLSIICTFYGVKNGDWFFLYLFHFQDTCGSVPNIFFYEKYNQGEINTFHICNFVDFNFQLASFSWQFKS